jgi:hypothetical protein
MRQGIRRATINTRIKRMTLVRRIHAIGVLKAHSAKAAGRGDVRRWGVMGRIKTRTQTWDAGAGKQGDERQAHEREDGRYQVNT